MPYLYFLYKWLGISTTPPSLVLALCYLVLHYLQEQTYSSPQIQHRVTRTIFICGPESLSPMAPMLILPWVFYQMAKLSRALTIEHLQLTAHAKPCKFALSIRIDTTSVMLTILVPHFVFSSWLPDFLPYWEFPVCTCPVLRTQLYCSHLSY